MAKFKLDLSNVDWKKVIAVTVAVAGGVMASLGDLKEKERIDNLEKTVELLKSKSEGS